MVVFLKYKVLNGDMAYRIKEQLVVKRVLVLVVLSLFLVTSIASAATLGEFLSMQTIQELLDGLEKTSVGNKAFNFDKSGVDIGENKSVVVSLQVRMSHALFIKDDETTIPMVAGLWKSFDDIHSRFSESELVVSLIDDDEVLMFVANGDVIINMIQNTYHDFPE